MEEQKVAEEKKLLVNLLAHFNREKKIVRGILVVGGVLLVLALFAGGTTYVYGKMYVGKVYPGVAIGELSVGGLTRDEVKNALETANNRYAKEGIALKAFDKDGVEHAVTYNTVVGNDDNPVEVVWLESGAAADNAVMVGRTGNWFHQLVDPLMIRFVSPVTMHAQFGVNTDAANTELKELLSPYEDPFHNARVIFADRSLEPKVEAEKDGYVFDYITIQSELGKTVGTLSFAPLSVRVQRMTPTITAADIEKVLPKVKTLFSYGAISLNYTDPQTKQEHDWSIAPITFSRWLELRPDADNNLVFGLSADKVKSYMDTTVRPWVDSAPQEAKFTMEDGKVKEFKASHTGLSLNFEKTYTDLDTAFRERNFAPTEPIKTVGLTVDIAEPAVKTADVNTLGITDVVGVGVSSFRGSHPARIKNVARAVGLLNGVLIKPGETFSTAKNVGPITEANGYLPELVIKGDDASQKEVGGGMCQIGTTLFRMAMNSGMPIVERRNHSLVVNYYADPVNGNPGTDATIYDPLVDFKFNNDTGNYLLLQTDMNMKTLQLTFTLWGKPDGRTGSYTHPVVSKWIPTGPATNVAVADGTLAPGQKRCQPAYRGAVASFTYTRTTSSSPEKIDQVFTSYYRPLPATCYVGVEPGSPCLADNSCFAVASTTAAQ